MTAKRETRIYPLDTLNANPISEATTREKTALVLDLIRRHGYAMAEELGGFLEDYGQGWTHPTACSELYLVFVNLVLNIPVPKFVDDRNRNTAPIIANLQKALTDNHNTTEGRNGSRHLGVPYK